MPIRLDLRFGRERFEAALALARGGTPLPQEWIDRAREIGSGPSKTFIPMLGTVLLAKATDARIDPFALKARKHRSGYSARSFCKDVLVPAAVSARVNLGTTGREPLNNQPFLRSERISRNMDVLSAARPQLDQLCEALEAIRTLDETEALKAFAAFLLVRIEDGPRPASPLDVDHVAGVPELIDSISRFISVNPESGKRGQALVAACLDLIYSDVKTTRVFDPSRHWPGDVVALAGAAVALAVEVKQRPASPTEVLQFVERCAVMGVQRAIVAALSQASAPLNEDELQEDAWRQYGVHLSILGDVGALVRAALTWTAKTLEEARAELPQRMVARLRDVEASPEALEAWAALFKAKA